MGIQDRDYYREGPSFLDRMGQQGATVWLIAVTVGVFFGQILSQMPGKESPLVTLGAYDPRAILDGEVWRLLTACFLHSGLWHLFFNMLVLHWAGGKLEELRGPRESVLFYLIGGVAANVLFLAAYLGGLTGDARAIGASGAVTAALVVFACHFPHSQVRLWFVLPMPVWVATLLFVGLDCMFGFSNVPDPRGNIAYFGHLGGAAFGLLYYQSGIRLSSLFTRSPKTRARPRLRVIPAPSDERPEPVGAAVAPAPRAVSAPADEQLEAKLDAVLAKVSKHGPESLTAEEREILQKASELYKKRRK